jgi:hypothetical protein
MKGVIRGVATVMMIWISKIGRGIWEPPKVPEGGEQPRKLQLVLRGQHKDMHPTIILFW